MKSDNTVKLDDLPAPADLVGSSVHLDDLPAYNDIASNPISGLQSAVKGAEQGVSFGFADELKAAVQAAAGKKFEEMNPLEETLYSNPLTAGFASA